MAGSRGRRRSTWPAGRSRPPGTWRSSRGCAPSPKDLFWYLPHETYLITVKEEPSITLGDYVREILPTLPLDARRQQIRRLTLALARLLRILHDRSLSHRDLKAANILIVGDPSSPTCR